MSIILLATWGVIVNVAWAALVGPSVAILIWLTGRPFGGPWLSPVALIEYAGLTVLMLGYLWRRRGTRPSREKAGLFFGIGLCEWVAFFPVVRLYEFGQWLSG